MKYVEIKCPYCNRLADKRAAEVKRQDKHGKKVYCSKECAYSASSKKRIKYLPKIKNCKFCDKEFVSSDALKARKCCSNECAIKLARNSQTKDHDKSRSEKCKEAWKNGVYTDKATKPRKRILFVEKTCPFCELKFLTKRKKAIYCSNKCAGAARKQNSSILEVYRRRCAFDFNLADFPEEFDFDLIRQYGWYSPTNKNNNLTGVSRDHMVSVKYGFENNIDPEIISHPANCKLMLQSENFLKKEKCSISFSELKERIKYWNKKYKL